MVPKKIPHKINRGIPPKNGFNPITKREDGKILLTTNDGVVY